MHDLLRMTADGWNDGIFFDTVCSILAKYCHRFSRNFEETVLTFSPSTFLAEGSFFLSQFLKSIISFIMDQIREAFLVLFFYQIFVVVSLCKVSNMG